MDKCHEAAQLRYFFAALPAGKPGKLRVTEFFFIGPERHHLFCKVHLDKSFFTM